MDWGFPRWRGYEASRDTEKVKICDRHGCEEPGKCPAPKSPHSDDRWYFCQKHAAEYNKNWDYFQGLDDDEAAAREHAEKRTNKSYSSSSFYGWAGPGDGTRSGDELRALEVLELDPDSDFATIKKSFRQMAKMWHPDLRPNDEEAAEKFQAIQLAYAILKDAEDRKSWKG